MVSSLEALFGAAPLAMPAMAPQEPPPEPAVHAKAVGVPVPSQERRAAHRRPPPSTDDSKRSVRHVDPVILHCLREQRRALRQCRAALQTCTAAVALSSALAFVLLVALLVCACRGGGRRV